MNRVECIWDRKVRRRDHQTRRLEESKMEWTPRESTILAIRVREHFEKDQQHNHICQEGKIVKS